MTIPIVQATKTDDSSMRNDLPVAYPTASAPAYTTPSSSSPQQQHVLVNEVPAQSMAPFAIAYNDSDSSPPPQNKSNRKCYCVCGLIVAAVVATVAGLLLGNRGSERNSIVSFDGEYQLEEAGWAVSLNGNGTLVAMGLPSVNTHRYTGASTDRVGRVWVASSTWTQSPTVIEAGDKSNNEVFGSSVALSTDGNVLVVGDHLYGNTDRGGVQAYARNGGWSPMGDLLVGVADADWYGRSLALSANGRIVAVGAVQADPHSRAGYVQILEYNNNNTWTQLGSTVLAGEGGGMGYSYGFAVDLSADGRTVVVGDYRNSGSGSESGHVQVFDYDDVNEAWVQRGQDLDGKLFHDDEADLSSDFLGWSVSVSEDGNIVAIGAPQEYRSGYAGVVEWNSSQGIWQRRGNVIQGDGRGDSSHEHFFGNGISLSGDGSLLAVADYKYRKRGKPNTGQVRVFKWNGADYKETHLFEGENEADYFGQSISLSNSGTVLAIGAPGNDDGPGVGSGKVELFSLV